MYFLSVYQFSFYLVYGVFCDTVFFYLYAVKCINTFLILSLDLGSQLDPPYTNVKKKSTYAFFRYLCSFIVYLLIYVAFILVYGVREGSNFTFFQMAIQVSRDIF